MAVIPLQAATMGYIPGGPFCIAVHGLLKCGGTRGGQVRRVKLPRLREEIEFEHPSPVIDVTHLEVLVSAMADDIGRLRGRIIDEAALRQVEEEIAALLIEIAEI